MVASKKTVRTLLIIVLLVYALLLTYTTRITGLHGMTGWSMFDDGMISMRYARYFASGQGLVWNPKEYVEGFTNPAWTLLGAMVIRLTSVDLAPLVMQLIGVALLIFCCYLTMRLVDKLTAVNGNQGTGSGIAADCAVAFCYFVWYPDVYWSVMGMEVSACLAIAALSANVWAGSLPVGHKAARLFLLVGVAWLVRPDASLIVLPFLVSSFLEAKPFRNKGVISKYAALVVALIAFFAIVIAFRYFYYGEITPNTYTLKVTGYEAGQRLSNGIGYISLFLQGYGLLVFGFIVLSFVLLPNAMLASTLIALPIILISYQTYVGGDPWTYWRQLTPAIVPMAAIIATAVSQLFSKRASVKVPKWKSFAVNTSMIFCILGLALGDRPFWKEMFFVELPYTVPDNAQNFRTAEALNDVLAPDALVLAFWAGTIPYYRFGPSLDPLGKTDRFIAELRAHKSPVWGGMVGVPGHNKYDLNHSVIEAQPDYIQYSYWGDEPIYRPEVEKKIHDDYVLASYEGVPLCLRRNSAKVNWSSVKVGGACP